MKRFIALLVLGLCVGYALGYLTEKPVVEPKPEPVPVQKVEVVKLPVIPKPIPSIDPEQHQCLALNIYHEAKNQSEKGQIAVGLVTLNRVADPRWPGTICGVVYQAKMWKGNPIRNMCQFSFFCDGKSDKPIESVAWKTARGIATLVMENHDNISDITFGADHYHADYVNPWWSKKFAKVATIGNHIFYKK